MQAISVLGIDVGKQAFHVALERSDGKLKHKRFPNTVAGFRQLADWLAERGVERVHAAVEATGGYEEALAIWLHDAGHRVSVLNPAQVQAYAKSLLTRNKTDRADASVIARFVAAQDPAPWTPPAPEYRQLQALVRRLDGLKAMRQQELNRREAPEVPDSVARSIDQVVAGLDDEIHRLQREINDHIDRHPRLQDQQELLTSIPGVGSGTAQHFLAESGDIQRFASARQLAAALGLTPQRRQSGISVQGPTRLSKTGNPRLRKALYFPAMVAATHNPVVRAFCQRLRDRGKAPKAVIGAAMRKLVHIAFGVLKHQKPFDPTMAQTT